MSLFEVNVWAILVATLVSMIIGGIWYSPKVFGEVWARSHGFNTNILNPSILNYVGGFFVALVTSWGLAVFVNGMHITNIGEALMFAFFAWITFIVTSHFSGVIWAKKPFQAYVIDALCLLIIYIVVVTILTFWP